MAGMTISPPGKSLWEYILLVVSAFATLVQVLGLISQSQALFARPSITATFVVIVLIGTTTGCIFVLIRKKLGTFGSRVPYYTRGQRVIAGGLLGVNSLVSMLVLGFIISRPCLTSEKPITPGKFGILVANFTEGLNRSPTFKGVELTQRTLNALNARLATSSLADKVELRQICAIRNADEAHKAGQSANASLVLWGNVAEFAQDTFDPSFTFVDPLLWPPSIDPVIFEVELSRVDSIELPSKISARTTSISALIIGLIYLREAKNTEGFNLAIREFSSAISNTEPELKNLVTGSQQEVSVKRTLAIFYVLQGRAHAALSNNDRALEDYSVAETYDPYYPSIYVAKGNYYYGLREFSQAEAQYRKAITLLKTSGAYYGLGNALSYLNRYQESKEAYLEAIRLIESKGEDPSSVRLVLGVVYNLNGEAQLALNQWNLVLQSEKSSEIQKQQAQNLVASILNPTPTPTVAVVYTATPAPTSMQFVTMSIIENTPTQRPQSSSIATQPRTLVMFTHTPNDTVTPTLVPSATATLFPTVVETPTLFPTVTLNMAIYDFDSGSIIGYMSCSEVSGQTWNLEPLPDTGTIVYSSEDELFGSANAGYYWGDLMNLCSQ